MRKYIFKTSVVLVLVVILTIFLCNYFSIKVHTPEEALEISNSYVLKRSPDFNLEEISNLYTIKVTDMGSEWYVSYSLKDLTAKPFDENRPVKGGKEGDFVLAIKKRNPKSIHILRPM